MSSQESRSRSVPESLALAARRTPPRIRAFGMRGPQRRIVLSQIFKMMPRQFNAKAASGVEAVVHWVIGGDRREDRWQLAIADGKCQTSRRLDREPNLTITLGAAQFLDLVTGVGSGPAMFSSGDLKLEGDLMLALRLQGLFRVPSAAPH